MGEKTAIAWTDHTFNPWWGCAKVSPGCKNCYAEAFAGRMGLGVWGRNAPRRFFDDQHWNEPRRWNRAAEKAGERRRVFCSSMADVLEDRPDLVEARARLCALIDETPWLDWLLLTKRIENVHLLPPRWIDAPPCHVRNVWMGVTAEDQERADERVARLLLERWARYLFVSYEPALGPIDFTNVAIPPELASRPGDWRINALSASDTDHFHNEHAALDLVIVGGESGAGARLFDVAWARSVIGQCRAAGRLAFVKQDSGPRPGRQGRIPDDLWIKELPHAVP